MTITGEDRELFERSLRHATSSSSGESLDAALVDLGWHDAHDDDPRTAVSLLFELQGRSGATSSALDVVLGAEPGTAVVLPPLGEVAAPVAHGVALAGIERASKALVGGAVVAVADLGLRRVDGLDPSLGLVEVTVTGPPPAPVTGAPWTDAVARGQLALGHEIVGASRAMLELARLHAIERVQFDRPIAQFQAVRHKLAETLVAIEAADGALVAAWEDGTPTTAAVAKAVAGRSARVAAKHCQQVLAGIGFTMEHAFHHHLRRALVLDRLLGDSKTLTKSIGEQLLRSRRIPPMLPL
jgi:hypothetical protein